RPGPTLRHGVSHDQSTVAAPDATRRLTQRRQTTPHRGTHQTRPHIGLTDDRLPVVQGMAREVETRVDADLVSFTMTFTSPAWDRSQVSRSTLRFLGADALAAFLSEAGLVIEEQF